MVADTGLQFYFLFIALAIIAVIILSILGKFISLWFQAFVSGTPISLFNIIGMSLRKIPPRVIVSSRINSYKAGLKEISVEDLETHFLAGGHVKEVVDAMIAADKANIPLDWRRATAIDLAGRDLREAIRTSVLPKVIDCPSHGSYITGVAKDGIQILVRARVTVRTNIAQLVGGATEETIIARVGEGIVSAIGGSDTHHLPHRVEHRRRQRIDPRHQQAMHKVQATLANLLTGLPIRMVVRQRMGGAGLDLLRAQVYGFALWQEGAEHQPG